MPITVRVPATSANLGPAFDCLGLALTLHNTVTLEKTARGLSVSSQGEGENLLPVDESNLVVRAITALFEHAGQPLPGLNIGLQNRIPIASGLGGSAAAVLGGLLAGNCLLPHPLPKRDLLTLATLLEGHPDNVAPALYGGLVLVNQDEGQLLVQPLGVPALRVVVVMPDFQLSTVDARKALPKQVPLADAVFNVGRAALLVQALTNGDYGQLRVAMQDRLHQPYRTPLVPGMNNAFSTALDAGAAGVAISGSGPSVVAFAPDNHDAIGNAMRQAFSAAGLSSRMWVLDVDRGGCVVEGGAES